MAALERAGSWRPLAGEVELRRRAHLGREHHSFTAWVGWTPSEQDALNERLAGLDAAVVELTPPPWVEPPTQLRPVAVQQPFRPLVESYGTTRYRTSIRPSSRCSLFVVMFGMMSKTKLTK